MQSLHRLVLDPRFAEHGLRTGQIGPREEGVLAVAAAFIPCVVGALGLLFSWYPPVALLWFVQSVIVLAGMVLAYRANASGDSRDFARRCICVAPGHFLRAFILLHLAYWAAVWLLRMVRAQRISNAFVPAYSCLPGLVLFVSFAGLIVSVKRLSHSPRAVNGLAPR